MRVEGTCFTVHFDQSHGGVVVKSNFCGYLVAICG
jgi:hypothetical protein